MTHRHVALPALIVLVMACYDREPSDASNNQASAAHPGSDVVAARGSQEEVDRQQMPFDQMFIDNMIEHHKEGQDASRIALDRAEHAELKSMAQEKIATDEAQIAQMKEWRRAWYGGASSMAAKNEEQMPGASSTKAMKEHMDMLKSAEQFDLAFIDMMIPHHQGAVDMAKTALDQAQHAELKSLAATIARGEETGIEMMRKWRDEWYPNAQAMGEPSK